MRNLFLGYGVLVGLIGLVLMLTYYKGGEMPKLYEMLDQTSKAKLDKVDKDIKDRQHAKDFVDTYGIKGIFEVATR